MGFIDDIRIRLLIMDYSLDSNGNRLLYSLASSSLGLSVLVIPFLLQYLEMSRQMPIVKIYYLIKYRIIKYPLTLHYYRKYCFYLKIMFLFLYNSFFNTLTIIFAISHIFTFGSYPRNGLEIYSIIGQILGNVTFFITYYYACAFWIFVILIGLSSTLYLKYKFEEINTKIELSLKQMNIRLLMNAIHEHNYVERLTRDINSLLSKFIFIFLLYFNIYLATFLIYITQKRYLACSQVIFPICCIMVFIYSICNEYGLRSNMYPSTQIISYSMFNYV